jgi:hypothetical protein
VNPVEANINEIAQQMCRRGILPIALLVISGIINTRSGILVHIVLAEAGRAIRQGGEPIPDQIRPGKLN